MPYHVTCDGATGRNNGIGYSESDPDLLIHCVIFWGYNDD